MDNATCWLGLGAEGPAGEAGRRGTDVLENSRALFSDIRIYTPWKWKCYSLSRVQLSVTPWTWTHQATLSMGFSRQEYWSGLPFPSPGDLSDPGIEPRSPAFQAILYHLSHQGSHTHTLGYSTYPPVTCPKGIFILAHMETRMIVFMIVEFVLTGHDLSVQAAGVKTQNSQGLPWWSTG